MFNLEICDAGSQKGGARGVVLFSALVPKAFQFVLIIYICLSLLSRLIFSL